MDDLTRVLKEMSDRITHLERDTVRLRKGVVTDDSPLSVALGGSDIAYEGVPALDGPTLATDDIVSVLAYGNALLVLGEPTANPGPASNSDARAAGASTVLTTSLVAYLTAAIAAKGRPCIAHYYFVYSNANSGGNRTIQVQSRLDGVAMGQTRTLSAPLLSGAANPLTAHGVHLFTPAAGSRTVDIRVSASAGSAVTINEAELVIHEL